MSTQHFTLASDTRRTQNSAGHGAWSQHAARRTDRHVVADGDLASRRIDDRAVLQAAAVAYHNIAALTCVHSTRVGNSLPSAAATCT